MRNAIKAKGGATPTGEDVKKGMEAIKGFTLGGFVPPMEITPTDHEGGGWVQIWTVKGGKLVKVEGLVPGQSPDDPEAPRGRRLEVLNATVNGTGGERSPPDFACGSAMLSINNIEVVYDRVILVLKGVSIDVGEARSRRCWAPTAPARRRR